MSDTAFKDHFSGHAGTYRAARPTYPAALFDWLATLPAARGLAWDAGCGNGQATTALAAQFAAVVGTDASAAQIAHAAPHPRVDYRVEPAEATTLAAGSVDLVTVAQALHWFDLPRFHAEVRRVARPGAVIAVWSYGLCTIAPDVDALVQRYYAETVGPYWPPERVHIERGYADLPFPFVTIAAPAFAMHADWCCAQFLAYLDSWSATQRCRAATGRDPRAPLADALAAAWGGHEAVRHVRWPLGLRAGRIE